MDDKHILENLGKLTAHQREILDLICQGKDNQYIAKRLFITNGAVRAHKAAIDAKLGIDHFTVNERKKIIFQQFCPALHQPKSPEIINEPEEPESEPQEPTNEEKSEGPEIIDVKPVENKPSQINNVEKPIKIRRGWVWAVVILIVLVLMVICGINLFRLLNPFISNFQVATEQANSKIEESVQETIQVQPTTQPTRIPTQKVVVVPTNTELPATPVPTHTPAPKITLPFIDDFSNGINSPWSVGYGKWFVTDSGASISISDIYDDAGSIVLDDPTLTDYKLRVKVHTPHMWSASQGQFGVIVRYRSNRDQNIIFYMNSNGRFKWAYIESMSELPFFLPDVTGVDKDLGSTDVTLEIVVSGNTFTARVDGANVDQFSMTGYENGGIALITSCGRIGSCPSFSDLSIESIN